MIAIRTGWASAVSSRGSLSRAMRVRHVVESTLSKGSLQ